MLVDIRLVKYIYIYIYIYIYGYICVDLCVCSWMGGQRRDLIFGRSYLRGNPLSILAQRPHKKLCPRKHTTPEGKDEGRWSVKTETPRQSVKSETLGWVVIWE